MFAKLGAGVVVNDVSEKGAKAVVDEIVAGSSFASLSSPLPLPFPFLTLLPLFLLLHSRRTSHRLRRLRRRLCRHHLHRSQRSFQPFQANRCPHRQRRDPSRQVLPVHAGERLGSGYCDPSQGDLQVCEGGLAHHAEAEGRKDRDYCVGSWDL